MTGPPPTDRGGQQLEHRLLKGGCYGANLVRSEGRRVARLGSRVCSRPRLRPCHCRSGAASYWRPTGGTRSASSNITFFKGDLCADAFCQRPPLRRRRARVKRTHGSGRSWPISPTAPAAERMVGEAGIVLLACETLLLGGSNDLSIDDERRRTIVIERRQSKNSHAPSLVARTTCR